MKNITELHIGFQNDGKERCILSLNPDRNTSASWHSIKRDIAPNHELRMWFYGVRRDSIVENRFEQTKRAILDGSFGDWF
jgi:hypothetical protein